jgi:hypothetical protein
MVLVKIKPDQTAFARSLANKTGELMSVLVRTGRGCHGQLKLTVRRKSHRRLLLPIPSRVLLLLRVVKFVIRYE